MANDGGQKKDLTSVIDLSKNWTPSANPDDDGAPPMMEEKPIEKVDAFESMEAYTASNPMPEPPPDDFPAEEPAGHSAGTPPPPPPSDDPFALNSQPEGESPSNALEGLSGVTFDPPAEAPAEAPADEPPPPDPADLAADPAPPDFSAAPGDLLPEPAPLDTSASFTVVPSGAAIDMPANMSNRTETGFAPAPPPLEDPVADVPPTPAIPPEPEDPGLPPEPLPEPDSLSHATPSQKPSLAMKSVMNAVKRTALSTPVGKPAVAAAYPFSLLVTGRLSEVDQARLLDLIGTQQMGFSERDLEPQLTAGRLPLPRISEYAGIMVVQLLRDANVVMQFGPSDTIYASESTTTAEDDILGGDTSGQSRVVADHGSTDVDRIPVVTSEKIPGWDYWHVLETLALSAGIVTQSVEARRSPEYTETLEALLRELRFRALRRRAHGITGLKIQLDSLGLPTHYRLTVSGQAVIRTTGWVLPEPVERPPVVTDRMVQELLDPRGEHSAPSAGAKTVSVSQPPPPPLEATAVPDAAESGGAPVFAYSQMEALLDADREPTAGLRMELTPTDEPMSEGPSLSALVAASAPLPLPPTPKQDLLRAQANEPVPNADPPLKKPPRPEPPMAVADGPTVTLLKTAETVYREKTLTAETRRDPIPGVAHLHEEITGSLVEKIDPAAYDPESPPPEFLADEPAPTGLITPELPTLTHPGMRPEDARADSVVPERTSETKRPKGVPPPPPRNK
ncbi:MAG: hypothetical protein IT285_01440 [Bdellovibrionales bacterium]|nr:hypothetical protein [Bdellovibrionales bacterium]